MKCWPASSENPFRQCFSPIHCLSHFHSTSIDARCWYARYSSPKSAINLRSLNMVPISKTGIAKAIPGQTPIGSFVICRVYCVM